jgi:hypothetical protein
MDVKDMDLTQYDDVTALTLGWRENLPRVVYVLDPDAPEGSQLCGTFVPRGTSVCKSDAQSLLWFLAWEKDKRNLRDIAPECQHPVNRLYAWHAYDGTLCVCCNDCGAVLRGDEK